MKYLLVALLLLPGALSAQRLDPDWCLTCRDSREHFVAGAGITAASKLVLPKAKTWQRLAIVGTIAAAYELGQSEDIRRGPGYGFGPKDWLLGIAGALLTEWIWR